MKKDYLHKKNYSLLILCEVIVLLMAVAFPILTISERGTAESLPLMTFLGLIGSILIYGGWAVIYWLIKPLLKAFNINIKLLVLSIFQKRNS